MTINEHSITDVLFAHWLRRKREITSNTGGTWHDGSLRNELIDAELDRLRPQRNPNADIFILG